MSKHIAVIGFPFFGQKVANDISDSNFSKAKFYGTYTSKKAILKFILNLPFFAAIYSVNGVSRFSGLLFLSVFFRKKVVLQWVGTDVSLLPKSWKSDWKLKYILQRVNHFSEAPWLIAELEQKGIKAEPLIFTTQVPVSLVSKKKQVLSYLGANKEDFYGWARIETLAKQFPDVAFILCGTSKKSDLPNVTTKGWVKNFKEYLAESLIFLRLTDHDGLPSSIIEALAYGCFVGFIESYPHCAQISKEQDGEVWLRSLINHEDGPNGLGNKSGHEWALATFDPKTVISNLVKKITANA